MPINNIRLQEIFHPGPDEDEAVEVNFVSDKPVAEWPTERFVVVDKSRQEGRFILSAVSGGDAETPSEQVVLEFDSLKPGSKGTIWTPDKPDK